MQINGYGPFARPMVLLYATFVQLIITNNDWNPHILSIIYPKVNILTPRLLEYFYAAPARMLFWQRHECTSRIYIGHQVMLVSSLDCHRQVTVHTSLGNATDPGFEVSCSDKKDDTAGWYCYSYWYRVLCRRHCNMANERRYDTQYICPWINLDIPAWGSRILQAFFSIQLYIIHWGPM